MISLNHLKLATLVAALALAGCSSTKLDDVPVESRNTGASTAGAAGTGANAGATSQSQVASVDLTKNSTAAMSNLPRMVYFDFDSYVVKDEYRPTVEANAKALTGDRKKHLAVEGHTDERGGREYNLALGLLGITDNQVEAVSFGKEKPAAMGSDEAAWAQNRRAEIAYR